MKLLKLMVHKLIWTSTWKSLSSLENVDFSILNWWQVHIPHYPILSLMA